MKFYRLSNVTFYDIINTIYQIIKPFLDRKCLFLRTMEPLISLQNNKEECIDNKTKYLDVNV